MVTTGVGTLLLGGRALIPGGLVPAEIRDVPPRASRGVPSKLLIVSLVVRIAGVLDYRVRKGDPLLPMSVRSSSLRV